MRKIPCGQTQVWYILHKNPSVQALFAEKAIEIVIWTNLNFYNFIAELFERIVIYKEVATATATSTSTTTTTVFGERDVVQMCVWLSRPEVNA